MRKHWILGFLFAMTVLAYPAFPMGGPAPTRPSASIEAPAVNAQIIHVTAKQYEFMPSTITVKKGVPVRLILTSQDVTHGFAIDALKINATVEKGKDTIVDFTPMTSGNYDFYCSVFCGFGHMGMKGKLIVED